MPASTSAPFSASALVIPDPIRRGSTTLLWIIHDPEGTEVDRFPGFRIATPDDALVRHRERVAERAAEAARHAPRRRAPRRVAPVRPALLYHFTTGAGLLGILDEDRIRDATQHILDGRCMRGVSLTRDRWFDYEAVKPFRLAIDPDRMPVGLRTVPVRDAYIRGQHKAHPISDGERDAPFNEAEEFLPGPLRPVSAALVEIAVLEDLLDAADGDPTARRALRRLADLDLPSEPRLLAVDRRRPFGRRERPLDPGAVWPRAEAAPAPEGPIEVPSWPALRARVLHDARLPDSRHHGDCHWRAVAAAGRLLCARVPGAERTAVMVFALVHDAMRINDNDDPAHGRRAAAYLRDLVEDGLVAGGSAAIERLALAIGGHADGGISADPTVACCWDADRLNLWRINVEPDPDRLCTVAARESDTIAWAMDLHTAAPSWDDVLAEDFDPRRTRAAKSALG